MWVDSSLGVPIGAEVRLSETGQLQLIDDEGKVTLTVKTLELHHVDLLMSSVSDSFLSCHF